MRHLTFALFLVASPAAAGVEEAVGDVILPAYADFAGAAGDLDAAAAADCRPAAVLPAYHAAFDAWMGVADLHLGPAETAGLAIAFWPDERGFTERALRALIAAGDPALLEPEAFAEVSVAGRGFFALDRLLGDPGFGYGPEDHACALVRAVAHDLALRAEELSADWQGGFADTLTSAGAPDNATYLDPAEAARALYTQVLAGLEFTADSRLGLPLGSLERPRPTRAEAWRTGRSLRNAVLATEAAVRLARALAGTPLPRTEAALDRVRTQAGRVADPTFQDLEQPASRFLVEVLQQSVRAVKDAVEAEVGTPLGLAPGFNSQDGD